MVGSLSLRRAAQRLIDPMQSSRSYSRSAAARRGVNVQGRMKGATGSILHTRIDAQA